TEQLDSVVAASPSRARVIRLGWVDDATRDGLIARASVFAYPSRYEGFGLSPLQAMAMGTPVVATNCGALKEVLGDAAWLVEAGDEGALANAIGALVDDDDAHETLSKRGLERAGDFSWQTCAAGLASVYRQAAEAKLN